jgi:DNA primase
MNTYCHFADTVKREVSMEDAARFYGLTFNRAGFSNCPFHAEKTPSFKIHNNKGKCFGCGWSGDVIAFVGDMFKLDFPGTIRKLNDDFGLSLPLDRKQTLKEKLESEKRYREIETERKRAEAERQAYDELYHGLWDEYVRFDIQRRDFAPKNPEDELNPLYVEAVKNISNIEYQIDVLL